MARPTKQAAEAVEALGETLSEYLSGGALRQPKRDSTDDALAFTAGLLFGGLAAGVTAIFLAPTDGRTLRARLTDRFNSLMGYDTPPAAVAEPAPAAHVVVTAEEMEDSPPAGQAPRTDAAVPSGATS